METKACRLNAKMMVPRESLRGLRVKKRVLLMEQDGLLGLNQDVQTECHENNKEREVFLAIREREMVI